jgi:hypothetical protein
MAPLLHLQSTPAPTAHTGVWRPHWCFGLQVHSVPRAYLSISNRPSRILLVLLSSLDYHLVRLRMPPVIAYPFFKPCHNFQLGFEIRIHIFKADRFLDLPKNTSMSNVHQDFKVGRVQKVQNSEFFNKKFLRSFSLKYPKMNH